MCVCICQSRVCVPERWWLVLVYECCIVGVLCMFMSAPVCVCVHYGVRQQDYLSKSVCYSWVSATVHCRSLGPQFICGQKDARRQMI